jgi:hypothetical protein
MALRYGSVHLTSYSSDDSHRVMSGCFRPSRHFVEGGDFGNREEEINRLVRRMN